jgi:hypothetical protein
LGHEYDNCTAYREIENLKRWQQDQNNKLGRLADGVQELCEHEARRAGAEGMLKWIIGVVGFSGVMSLVGVIVGLVT